MFGLAAAGITLQMVQQEDATPAYRYFTIWSAAIVGVYGSGLLARFYIADSFIRTAGSAGAVFSGIVYFLAIAPVKGLGHQPLTIMANVVLHLLIPALVLVLYLRDQRWRVRPTVIAASLSFPAIYLAWTLCMTEFTGIRPAYLFLDSGEVGHGGVAAAVTGAAVTYLIVAWTLSRIAGRRRH